MNSIYTGYNWKPSPRDPQPKPSEWLPCGYAEEVYDAVDEQFYMGKLTGMDAGDVMSLVLDLQAEHDANEAEVNE